MTTDHNISFGHLAVDLSFLEEPEDNIPCKPVHAVVGLTPGYVQCPVCERAFKNYDGVDKHIRTSNGKKHKEYRSTYDIKLTAEDEREIERQREDRVKRREAKRLKWQKEQAAAQQRWMQHYNGQHQFGVSSGSGSGFNYYFYPNQANTGFYNYYRPDNGTGTTREGQHIWHQPPRQGDQYGAAFQLQQQRARIPNRAQPRGRRWYYS